MKHSTLLLAASALHTTTTTAWTFTWRTSSGSATTESGTGPSTCIPVNHAKGQIFAADGEGEENINMLLFSNDDCQGEPAGMATENFVKEASLDLRGFQVVALDGGDGDGDGEDGDDLDQTVTLPTVPATTTLLPTSTGSEDEDDETFTLPTEPATSSNETSTAEPTATSEESDSSTESPTPTETETETDSASEPSPTETDSDSGSETGSGEEDPAPTDAASRLGFSKAEIAGVVVCGLVGGWAVEALF